jgi:hypothetical protein
MEFDLTREELLRYSVPQLKELATSMNVRYPSRIKKDDLISLILGELSYTGTQGSTPTSTPHGSKRGRKKVLYGEQFYGILDKLMSSTEKRELFKNLMTKNKSLAIRLLNDPATTLSLLSANDDLFKVLFDERRYNVLEALADLPRVIEYYVNNPNLLIELIELYNNVNVIFQAFNVLLGILSNPESLKTVLGNNKKLVNEFYLKGAVEKGTSLIISKNPSLAYFLDMYPALLEDFLINPEFYTSITAPKNPLLTTLLDVSIQDLGKKPELFRILLTKPNMFLDLLYRPYQINTISQHTPEEVMEIISNKENFYTFLESSPTVSAKGTLPTVNLVQPTTTYRPARSPKPTLETLSNPAYFSSIRQVNVPSPSPSPSPTTKTNILPSIPTLRTQGLPRVSLTTPLLPTTVLTELGVRSTEDITTSTLETIRKRYPNTINDDRFWNAIARDIFSRTSSAERTMESKGEVWTDINKFNETYQTDYDSWYSFVENFITRRTNNDNVTNLIETPVDFEVEYFETKVAKDPEREQILNSLRQKGYNDLADEIEKIASKT